LPPRNGNLPQSAILCQYRATRAENGRKLTQSKVKYSQCLNKLEQDVEPAAKALAVSEPMAIFHPGDGKS